MTDFLLLILYASTPFAIIALTICLGNSLAERRAVELHWRNPFVQPISRVAQIVEQPISNREGAPQSSPEVRDGKLASTSALATSEVSGLRCKSGPGLQTAWKLNGRILM